MNAVNLVLEALKFGDGVTDKYFDPSKKRLVSTPAEPHEIEQILPASTQEDSRTIEVLTSESYATCVKKLATYLNIPLEQVYRRFPNMYAFNGIIMSTLQQVMAIEQTHKQELEQMAKDVVLELPEFSLFKELIEEGHIKLDVALGAAELQNSITEDDLEQKIEEQQEELVEELAPELAQDPERKLKRAFHNFVTQGNALHKSFLFQLASEKLSRIDPTLPEKYGLIMSIVHVLYYGTPYMTGNILKTAEGLGSEEVNGEDVKIRGLIFPVLVHEIVKGLFDYLGQDISPGTHGSETLEDEFMQLMTGPAIFKKLMSAVPNNKIKLFPIIYRMLLQKPSEQIKMVLSNSGEGKRIIDGIVIDAERQHNKDEQQKNAEPEQDYDFSFDNEDEDFGEGDEWKNA
jgi:hypothetical protein